MRILHTESSLGWGGQEHRTFKEAVGLQARGHEVWIAAPPDARLLARAQEAGLPVFPIRMRRSTDLSAIRALRRFMREQRFDIVNTHSSRDTLLAGLAARLLWHGPTVVRTRHLILPITSRSTYSLLPHHVVAVSEGVRQLLIDSKVAATRLTTVHTGIDLALYGAAEEPARRSLQLREALGLQPEHLLVGTVAILRYAKGHHVLLEAIPSILQQVPHARFVFAGDGPQTANLQRAIQEKGLSDKVFLLGLRRDIPEVLAALDLFVLPTLQEALGTSFIEAMAAGLPVVGTRVGGVPEVVRDGETGRLVPAENASALSAAIIELLQNAALRRAAGLHGRALAFSEFSADVMCDRMVALYQRLLSAP